MRYDEWIMIGGESLNNEEKAFFGKHKIVTDLGYSSNISHVKGIFAKFTAGDVDSFEILLSFRISPESYRIPCWIWGDGLEAFRPVLWPGVSRDYLSYRWNEKECERWMVEVALSDKRLVFFRSTEGRLQETRIFEILMTLALEAATGTLKLAKSDGKGGEIVLNDGEVVRARSGDLTDIEAVFDLLSWDRGIYFWKTSLAAVERVSKEKLGIPLMVLLEDYCSLLKEDVQIFKMVRSLDAFLELKPSHCALDDPADPFFDHYKTLCHTLATRGASISDLLINSTLSPARTLFFVNRLIALGDATATVAPYSAGANEREDKVSVLPDQDIRKYRTLIVDDAPFFLKVLKRLMEKDDRFDIVGTARDGVEGLKKVEELDPDIVTMDLEMPNMDGLGALKRIMLNNPKPVVVLSAFTGETSQKTYEAFKFGAIDVIEKPKNFSLEDMERNAQMIRDRVARCGNIQIDQVRYLRKHKPGVKGSDTGDDVFSIRYPLFVTVFGYGDFSPFLRTLFYLDHFGFPASMIFILPVRYRAMRELFEYMREDCSRSLELLGEKDLTLKKDRFYISTYDTVAVAVRSGDNIYLSPRGVDEHDEVFRSVTNFIESLWKILGNRLIISTFSGVKEQEPYLRDLWRTKNVPFFYLTPEKCLYPDLSLKLRENSVGIEAKGIEELVKLWNQIIKEKDLKQSLDNMATG